MPGSECSLAEPQRGTFSPLRRWGWVGVGGHAAFGRRRVKAARWRESGQNEKHEGRKKGKAHPGPLFICSKLIDHLAVPPDEFLSDVGAVLKIPIIIPPPGLSILLTVHMRLLRTVVFMPLVLFVCFFYSER